MNDLGWTDDVASGRQAISPLIRHHYFLPCTCTRTPPPTHSTTSEHDIACPRPAPSHTFGTGEANCKGNARVPSRGDRSVQCRSFYRLLACSQAPFSPEGCENEEMTS